MADLDSNVKDDEIDFDLAINLAATIRLGEENR